MHRVASHVVQRALSYSEQDDQYAHDPPPRRKRTHKRPPRVHLRSSPALVHRARLEYPSAMSFAAASTMGKALVGVPVVAKKSSVRQMRASSGRRSGTKVVAMAGADAISATAMRWILAAPTMYAIVSFNEYVTHRYYQHAEFNKTDWMKKLVCLMTGKKEAPRCDGGGHIEHHAETLDDMSLKTDP